MGELGEALLEADCQSSIRGAWRVLWSLSLFAAFAGIGVALAMLGPTLLELSEQLDVSLATASGIFTCRAFGYLLGAQLGGELGRAPNVSASLLVPLLLSCAGTFAVPSARHFATTCVLFSFQGASMGLLDTGGNVVLLTIWRGSRYLNGFMHALHFFFGLGAFVAPFFLSIWLQQGRSAITAWSAVGLLLAPGCLGFSVLLLGPQPKPSEDPEGESAVSSVVLFSGLFLFFYVGIEVAYGGYIDAFAVRWLGASTTDAAELTSVYWGALCLGRLVAAAATPHVHHAWYLVVHLLLGLSALAALVVATAEPGHLEVGTLGWWSGVSAPTFGFGFALAPLFPGAMLVTEEVLGRGISGRAAALLVVLAALGEMVCPLFVGLLFAESPINFCWAQLVLVSIATIAFLRNGAGLLARKAHEQQGPR